MASFCTNCGSPVSGRFCTKCGVAIQEPSAQVQQAALHAETAPQGTAKAPDGSGAKFLVVVLGVLLLLGGMGVGTVVYVGYRAKEKITELKREYGVKSVGASGTSIVKKFPPSQGSGCKMLEGQEAAEVLGVAVERAEFDPNGPNGTQLCRYWVSATERQHLEREEMASSLAGIGKEADTQNGQGDIENLIGGAVGALNEVNNYNKDTDYAFSLQVWQKNGKEQWEKMEWLSSTPKTPWAQTSLEWLCSRSRASVIVQLRCRQVIPSWC